MTVRELIKYMLSEQDVTLDELAHRIGLKSKTCITTSYKSKNGYTSSRLVEICDALGYEVIVRKKREQEYLDTNNGIRVTIPK